MNNNFLEIEHSYFLERPYQQRNNQDPVLCAICDERLLDACDDTLIDLKNEFGFILCENCVKKERKLNEESDKLIQERKKKFNEKIVSKFYSNLSKICLR